jgi:FK506-binding protein 6
LEKGIGKSPPPGSKVWYHYVAYANDSSEPFDSTLSRNAESFIVGGSGEVIPGLRLALETMDLKEVAQFLIFHEYAYGKLGCPPRIEKGQVKVHTDMTSTIETSVRYL